MSIFNGFFYFFFFVFFFSCCEIEIGQHRVHIGCGFTLSKLFIWLPPDKIMNTFSIIIYQTLNFTSWIEHTSCITTRSTVENIQRKLPRFFHFILAFFDFIFIHFEISKRFPVEQILSEEKPIICIQHNGWNIIAMI